MSVLKVRDKAGKFVPATVVNIDTIGMGGYTYSEDEICVGCWTNGKPIYRKVLPEGVLTTSEKAFGNITNVDIVTHIYGILNREFPAPCFVNNSIFAYLGYQHNTKNVIACASGAFVGLSIQIVLEYTKTTDAENSFTPDMLYTGAMDVEATDEEVEEVFG